MFGQFAGLGVPVVPGVVVDGVDDAAGAGVTDGSGLAALTIAAPPTVSRPTASSSDATTRFTPEVFAIGADSWVDGAVSEMSWSCMALVPFDAEVCMER
jgi:hypothetical protein